MSLNEIVRVPVLKLIMAPTHQTKMIDPSAIAHGDFHKYIFDTEFASLQFQGLRQLYPVIVRVAHWLNEKFDECDHY